MNAKRQKTAMDIVSQKLDDNKYVIIPTNQVGALMHAIDGKGNIRNEAIELTITNINDMIYADSVQIMLGGS